jgi:hypothetical protein
MDGIDKMMLIGSVILLIGSIIQSKTIILIGATINICCFLSRLIK